jgi:glycosyltransferase involved in cell wall biosynthesis
VTPAQRTRVGYTAQGYNERRNFIDLELDGFELVRRYDLATIPRRAFFRLFGRVHPFFNNVHYLPFGDGVSLYHFFNTVSFGRTPWITTFETAVPRWNTDSILGLGALAGKACKRLIAMSKCAERIQRDILNQHSAVAQEISAKLAVRLPAQRVLREHPKEREDGPLTFVFVGADFFRKGGAEVLTAFERLLQVREARLIVVSALEFGDYASRATSDDRRRAISLMGRHPTSIVHHWRLPNQRVLDLLLQADVALLPTLADTFGYSVLEAQASACPVVTTNVRALPELNNDRVGWVLPLPLDDWGNAHNVSAAALQKLRAELAERLCDIMLSIVDDPADVRRRGQCAVDRIRSEHDPAEAARFLEGVYSEALKS